jgi:hypothetical protein
MSTPNKRSFLINSIDEDKLMNEFEDYWEDRIWYDTPHPNPAEPGNFKHNKKMSETMILPESFANLLSHTNPKAIDSLIDLHFGGMAETKEMKDKLRVFAVQSMLLYQTSLDEANQSEIAKVVQQHQQEMPMAAAANADAPDDFVPSGTTIGIPAVGELPKEAGTPSFLHTVTEQDAANNPDLAAEGIQPGDQIDIPAEAIIDAPADPNDYPSPSAQPPVEYIGTNTDDTTTTLH